MTSTTRLLTIGLATAATALSGGTALAQDDGRPVQNADLVALSGGALLHYELADGAKTQSVTIAGVKAQKVIALPDEDAMHALMNSGKRLKQGGSYVVVVRVKVGGKSVVYRDKLVLHRRHPKAS